MLAADMSANPLAYVSVADRPSQRPFFYDDHTVCFLVGGKRSGKSHCLITRLLMAMTGIEPLELPGSLALLPKPPVRVRYWCEDLLRTVRKVLQPIVWKLVPQGMADDTKSSDSSGYHKEEATQYFRNGSWLQFMTYGMQQMKGESAEVEIIAFDEPPQEDLYDSQWARILTTGGYIWGAMTLDQQAAPYDISWIEDRIMLKGDGPAVHHYALDTEENVRAVAAEHAASDPRRAQRILRVLGEAKEALSKDKLDMMLGGKGGWLQGRVYPRYNDKVHAAYDLAGPAEFVELARKGYGEIYGGMDHGASHPTYVAYVYVARVAVPDLDLLPGDHVQFAEYRRAGMKVVQHIPPLKNLHERYGVQAYWGCRRLWKQDENAYGPTAAQMYMRAGIRPLFRANDDVDQGIQRVGAMLEADEQRGHPRYRFVKGRCPEGTKSMRKWQFKKNARFREPHDRYSETRKDECDGIRYVCMAQCEKRLLRGPDRVAAVPLDPVLGVPVNLLTMGLDDVLR